MTWRSGPWEPKLLVEFWSSGGENTSLWRTLWLKTAMAHLPGHTKHVHFRPVKQTPAAGWLSSALRAGEASAAQFLGMSLVEAVCSTWQLNKGLTGVLTFSNIKDRRAPDDIFNIYYLVSVNSVLVHHAGQTSPLEVQDLQDTDSIVQTHNTPVLQGLHIYFLFLLTNYFPKMQNCVLKLAQAGQLQYIYLKPS